MIAAQYKSGKIIDSHLHLATQAGGRTTHLMMHDAEKFVSGSSFWSPAEAVKHLMHEMSTCNVGHAVVLHLLWQPWSVEEVAQALAEQPTLTGFVNINPSASTALQDVKIGFDLGFRGLKLHPRIQGYRPDDDSCVAVVRRAGELGMPVLIDCFPDGDWLMAGLNLSQYAVLARQAPDSKVIVAHAGGHHCLDLLMLAKRVKNLWFDVSYSLLYYTNPVLDALFYAMKSIRYERVLFGTDYPDRPLNTSVERSLDLFDQFGVDANAREKILWKNAVELLQLQPSA
jgi:predicted TIM-barrel fold metal-dependent hydrolase